MRIRNRAWYSRSILGGIVLSVLAAPAMSSALTVTVDADGSEWLGVTIGTSNVGYLDRGPSPELVGEYIWNDQPGDERTDFSSPDPNVDLTQLRVTGDADSLYVLATMTDITTASGAGAPQIQIAIDADRVDGSGEEWLASEPETKLPSAAQWEYLVQTRFGSGNADLHLYTHQGGTTN